MFICFRAFDTSKDLNEKLGYLSEFEDCFKFEKFLVDQDIITPEYLDRKIKYECDYMGIKLRFPDNIRPGVLLKDEGERNKMKEKIVQFTSNFYEEYMRHYSKEILKANPKVTILERGVLGGNPQYGIENNSFSTISSDDGKSITLQIPVSIDFNSENDNVEGIKTDIVNQLQAIDTFNNQLFAITNVQIVDKEQIQAPQSSSV